MEYQDRIAELIEEGFIHREAWIQLYNAFGERMQEEEIKLMDSVLQSARLDFKEQQDAL